MSDQSVLSKSSASSSARSSACGCMSYERPTAYWQDYCNAPALACPASRGSALRDGLTAQTLTCKTLHARAGRTRRAACRDARGVLPLSVCKRRDAVRLAPHDRRHTASCRVLRRVGRPPGSSCLFPWVISRRRGLQALADKRHCRRRKRTILRFRYRGRTSVPTAPQTHLACGQNAYRAARADHAPKPLITAEHRHVCRQPIHMRQAAWRTE
jgi:hypothetical protein